ncbi:MAG: alkaline phosphatase family protein [bacterium]
MKFRNVAAALVLIALLAAAGYAAQWLTLLGWNAVVEYPSPYARPLPSGRGGPALAGRVVLVVVDGLRLDTSERMSVLNALRTRGAAFVAWTGEPSLSLPGWTALVSGAAPEISGVTTNWYEGPVRVDTLFAAAKRSGLSTAVTGSPGWAGLFGPEIDEHILVGDPAGEAPVEAVYRVDHEVADGAMDILQRGQAQLVVVHFPSVDLVGHRFGGASAEYAEAARRVDGHLRDVLALLDLTRDTLLVTSDHGHLDAGGHGGWEPVVKRTPLVLAGRGIRSGQGRADVRQLDVAPTVAILLGIPIPSHNQGRPLVEAIDVDAAQAASRWIEQQAAFYRAQERVLRVDEPRSGDGGILAAANAFAGNYAAARADRLARERLDRLPLAATAIILPLLGVLWLVQRRLLWPALAGAAVFFAVDYALFFLRGYTFSLSVFNSEAQILAFFNQRLIEAALALAAGALVAGFNTARRGPADAFLGALGVAYVAAYAILVQVAYFYWQWDVRFAWYLPDMRLGFKYYLDLLMLVPVGFLAALSGVVGLLGRWLIRVTTGTRRGAAPFPKPG